MPYIIIFPYKVSNVVIVVSVDVIFNSGLPKVGRIVRHYEKRKKKTTEA